MRKILLILMLLTFFFTGCEKHYAPEIEYSEDVLRIYADYEIGVNFSDHMFAMASGKMEYRSYMDEYEDLIDEDDFKEIKSVFDILYTHKISYVFPQIFYYIPSAFNFDSKEKWEDYFNSWIEAISERDLKYVETYIEGTDVEGYIRDVFESTDDATWDSVFLKSTVIIEEAKKTFVKQFPIYKKTIWPRLSFELHKKCENINSMLKSENLIAEWEKISNYKLNTDQLVFSLSKIKNPDFEYVGLKKEKIVMYYNVTPEITEFVEVISHRLGYEIIIDNSSEIIKDLYEEYKYINERFDLYEILDETLNEIVTLYNRGIFGYENDRNYPYALNIKRITEETLDKITQENIFIIDDKFNYHGLVFEVLDITDDLKVYYHEDDSIFIEKDGEFNRIVDYNTSVPELSEKGDKLLFISPYEWEVIGDVYVYDLEDMKLTRIIESPKASNYKVKKAIWYDNNTIYLINGYAYGTVSQGGHLYKYNIRKEELEIVEYIKLEERQEISDVKIENNKFILTIVTFDEEYINYEESIMIRKIEN